MSLCKSDLGEVYGIHNAKSFKDTVKSKLCSVKFLNNKKMKTRKQENKQIWQIIQVICVYQFCIQRGFFTEIDLNFAPVVLMM